ncbi:MAG: hypothetical protein KatS3mg023_1676 [Armatimonadota bacterium]|nr:MAG: hypothetical protein KatS3mg023_1676 [Armatimonadota bacterium]
MDELSKRRKWRRWLQLVEAERQQLQEEHRLYTELREHLTGKPEWVSWIDALYLVGVSLAVRRLADANPRHRTVSLMKLLIELEAHAEYLSRRGALQGTDPARRWEVHRLFDSLGGSGSTHVPQAVLRRCREDFEQLTAPFRAWVDHRVAHHDLSADCPPPSREQVEQVLLWLRSTVEVLRLFVGDSQ